MNTKHTIREQRDRLTKEQEQLESKWEQLREEARKDERRLVTIRNELQRLEFVQLIGKPGAVKLRYREYQGEQCFHLNGLRGTVVKVKRTRAVVDFGAAGATTDSKSGKWNISLGELAPSETDKPEGELLNLGAT